MSDDQDQKSTQLRALLAFALSAAVLFLYQYFVPKSNPPKPPVITEPNKSDQAAALPDAGAAPKPATKAATSPATGAARSAPREAASQEQTLIVDTDTFLVAFSNRGAVVTSWTLKRYQDDTGKPLELVNSAAVAEAGYPFSYTPDSDLNQALFQVEMEPGPGASRLAAPVAVTFRWSDSNISARKRFQFSKTTYLVEVESTVTQKDAPLAHSLAWRGGFGDAAVEDSARSVKTFYFDAAPGKTVRREPKEAEKGPVVNAGNYLYAGIEDHYFAAAFITMNPGRTLQLETTALQAATSRRQQKQLFAGAAVGGAGDNHFRVYVGPKSLEALRAVRPELAQLVDFGWFSFIAYPLFLMLTRTHRWVPNFGWAIVLVTVVINFILFPLKLKSMKSMKKMQKLQPLIKHINDKYKGLPMRDPKRQQQNQEVMDLYSKYGVNPLGGCLPMLLQLPFFFAFYAVLNSSIEMRRAPWLWIKDLSSWDPIYLLPIAMVITQFLYQKLTPTTSADPAQQKMMQFMPLIMGFFFYRLPSGLVLYWLTGNLVGMAQQWFINRLPEPELEIEKPRRGRKGGKQ